MSRSPGQPKPADPLLRAAAREIREQAMDALLIRQRKRRVSRIERFVWVVLGALMLATVLLGLAMLRHGGGVP